jgi:hypothetical protein
VTEQEIIQIVNDWDDEWKISKTKTMQKETQELEKDQEKLEEE